MTTTKDILLKLHEKFSKNILAAVAEASEETDRAEVQCRALTETGRILEKCYARTEAQKTLAKLLHQVFADSISSIYLSGSGLMGPARILLRRGLELGIAVLYLWDLPHLFWEWSEKSKDLSFTEMTKHLSSDGYLTMVSKENLSSKDIDRIVDTDKCLDLYGKLSDVVHGKLPYGTADIENSFDYHDENWPLHVLEVEEAASVLLDGLNTRFVGLAEAVKKHIPALERIQ